MKEVRKFYKSFIQEILARQLANEEGDSQEQTFTRYVVDMLAETGETENADIAYDEKALGTKNQHKINAYAIADNYETVDLFISIFQPDEEIPIISKDEVKRATTRITNFFRKSIYDDYAKEVAESSRIFEFANTLASYSELRNNLIRVNAFIITNGEYKGDFPENTEISGYKIFYRVVDINYIYQISEESRVPIEINFDEDKFHVPCLSASNENDDYQSYVAIMPGQCLANLYERFGARLLEQNVRAFLSFRGGGRKKKESTNAGMRTTIKNNPHMFLAYNNGLAITADSIELNDSNTEIKKIKNLQIVNGGQTTASIYHTFKDDKADLSQVYVQIKISVIKKKESYSEIVSAISRFANTQNKVEDSDFSANNPKLVAFERWSRSIMTPITASNNIQTYWFFERARKQYDNLMRKEGFTKSRKKAFELKYPKCQFITKFDLSKAQNSYSPIYKGNVCVVGPHNVVGGKEKNYNVFLNYNMPEEKEITNIYYEDAIAKIILFKACEKIHGTRRDEFCIGDIRKTVVPYSIALLNLLTENRLNLYKIWKNQCISPELSNCMKYLMQQVNAFIIDKSPTNRYEEWAKKEECWIMVKQNIWAFDINDIASDLIDINNPPQRNVISELESDEDSSLKHSLGIIQSIPISLWKKFADWGQSSGCMSINLQTAARDTASKIKLKHKFTTSDINKAIRVYEAVCENNIELLEEADVMIGQEPENATTIPLTTQTTNDMTLDLVQKMVDWDRRKRILEDWKWNVMNDVVQGRKPFTDRMKYAFYLNLEKLKKQGFEE